MKKAKKKVVGEGIPLDPDVAKLDDAYPAENLYDGRILPHYNLERIIGARYGTDRYASVLAKWRKQLKKGDSPIFIEFDKGDYGIGPRVLNDSGKLRHLRLKSAKARRRTREARYVSQNIDRKSLSEAELSLFDKAVDKVNRMIASHTLRGKPSKKMEKAFDLSPRYRGMGGSEPQQEAAPPA